ncbi:tyrosine-type recombinase/integrase [Candidatus Saccharibacteria bacterium]|nr:tyrosine-type recombinase/integrase [Candidatus Saccharibacteria bacterium]
MKISEAFDQYRYHATIEGQSRRVVEHTDYVKRKMVEYLGDIELASLDIEKIYRWRQFMLYKQGKNGEAVKRKPNSLRCDILRLRCMLKYMEAVGEDCISWELVPIPKHEDTVRTYLEPQEVTAMIEGASSVRNKAMLALLYSSGVRVSELVSLNRDSIHDRSFTVIGKGKKARLCFIDKRTEKLLAEYLGSRKDDSNALFVSHEYKERLSISTVQFIMRYARKKLGIEKHVTPHVFRHSFATNYIKNDGDIRPLSKLLGHANLDTTAIYTHMEDNTLRRCYEKYHTI